MSAFFRSFLTKTIHVAEPTGVDRFGSKTYGAPVPMRARVQVETAIVRGATEDADSSHVVYVHGEISRDARVWLPGEDTTDPNASHKPLSVGVSESLDTTITLTKVRL